MEITVTKKGETTIVKPIGRIDSNTSAAFEDYIGKYPDEGTKKLIVDFESSDYISSMGLRVILNTAKMSKSRKVEFVACSMQDHVREIFEISGFDSFITIYSSLAEAMGDGAS